MIALRDLEKSFPQGDGRLYVLRRVALDAAAGDFVTLMGPSGAGQSTLLAVLGMPDGAENRAMPLSYREVKPEEREAAVATTLDRFGMVAKKNLYPRQLSGGQQQLVGVARAVIHKPALLLADEPTGNLHSDQGREIMQLFRELNAAGTTIVQVTHSEENARYGS